MTGNSNFGFSGGGGGTPIPPSSTCWALNGNTVGVEKYFGTNDNFSIPIYTNGVPVGIISKTGSFGIGTVTPNASASLDITSTTRGFLAPRMTTGQRDAIASPATGLFIYNTSSSFFNYWSGAAWIQVDTSTGGDVSGSGTTNYATMWTDGANSVIGNGTWLFSGNDYLPVTTGSNIGDATHRIGTVFMSSVFDYASDLSWYSGATKMTLTTGGFLGVSVSPTATIHSKGSDATSANYAFKADNLASSPIAYFRNDQFVGFGTSTAIIGASGHKFEAAGISNGALGVGRIFSAAFSTTDAAAQDMGAGITLGGKYDSSGNINPFAGINGVKQTAINGDFSGRINLWVRGGPTAAVVSFTSVSYGSKIRNGMGITNPLALLHLNGDNADVFISETNCINVTGYAGKFYATIVNTQNNIGIYSEVSNGLANYSAILMGGNVGNGIVAPVAKFHNFGVDATTIVNQRLEPVTNVTEDTTGNTINTTDATANVMLQTIAVPTNKVLSIESTIVYRKTNGAGVGIIGDGTTIKLNSSVKNVAGTLTLDTIQNTYTGTVNAVVGASATYTISGTNVLVSVTGVVNDNITWDVITKIVS